MNGSTTRHCSFVHPPFRWGLTPSPRRGRGLFARSLLRVVVDHAVEAGLLRVRPRGLAEEFDQLHRVTVHDLATRAELHDMAEHILPVDHRVVEPLPGSLRPLRNPPLRVRDRDRSTVRESILPFQ